LRIDFAGLAGFVVGGGWLVGVILEKEFDELTDPRKMVF
jgi:hypothetical protein